MKGECTLVSDRMSVIYVLLRTSGNYLYIRVYSLSLFYSQWYPERDYNYNSYKLTKLYAII